MNDKELDKAADDILALIRGESGPFMEDDKVFFGAKRPIEPDRMMETDCGGMIITKAPLTYGQGDVIAAGVSLTEVMDFIKGRIITDQMLSANGSIFHGKLYSAIYSFLATKHLIPGSPKSYSNSMEYLYQKIIDRLVEAKILEQTEPEYYREITQGG